MPPGAYAFGQNWALPDSVFVTVLKGHGVQALASLRFSGTGIEHSTHHGSADTLYVRLAIAKDAAPGPRQVRLTFEAGGPAACEISFHILRSYEEIEDAALRSQAVLAVAAAATADLRRRRTAEALEPDHRLVAAYRAAYRYGNGRGIGSHLI